ncbi:MAG: phosphotransferase [Holophagales bacterium]|jgi:aminoglycoside/choline kinase family phosphotransferase|nr:phosphotransferase [Holophagales bacterium]
MIPMDNQLDQIAVAWNLKKTTPMLGDAGARRYFRAVQPSGITAVLVLYPDSLSGVDDPFQDFISLHSYVNTILRVPEIYKYDNSHRAMLIEDIGDCSLEARMTGFPQEELYWAERVAEELLDWVGPLTMAAPKKSFFTLRSFDRVKFDFEWSFCKEHFFNGLLQKKPPLWLDRMMEQIHDYLIPRAKYLAHRDFHVRNLMVSGRRPVTIDFQDARLGPATYDLASILFDSYWDWSMEARQILVSMVKSGLDSDIDFWSELNSVALQRNFKALGTFAFQLRQNKTRYAQAIPRALRHIHGHFERLSHGEGVIQAEHWLKLANERIRVEWPGVMI